MYGVCERVQKRAVGPWQRYFLFFNYLLSSDPLYFTLLTLSSFLSSCRTGEFSLRVADPQLFSQPETIQVQAVSMQVKYNSILSITFI